MTLLLLGLVPFASAWFIPANARVLRVPEVYPDIRSAVDACAPGDTVLLSPGTYRGPGNRDILFPPFDIVLRSEAGKDATIIDCESMGRGIELRDFQSRATWIEGITITRGRANDGGAVACSPAHATFLDCRFIDNYAGFDGGALDLLVGSPLFLRCEILWNRASDGGGAVYYFGSPEFVDCLFIGNLAGRGGAMILLGSGWGTPIFRGCTITRNIGLNTGGAFCYGSVILERSIVWGNCSWLGYREMRVRDAIVRCSAVDSSGVYGDIAYDEHCVFTNPMFCHPGPCGEHDADGYWLHADSPCLPEHSPCGELIGALGHGCGTPTPTGACCLPGGVCVIATRAACEAEAGGYMGDGIPCEPDPCVPTRVEPASWGRIKSLFWSGEWRR